MKGDQEKRAFSIPEAAKYACVSRTILDNWLVKGHLPYEELPGTGTGHQKFRRIRKKDLDTFLERYYHCERDIRDKPSEDGVFLKPR